MTEPNLKGLENDINKAVEEDANVVYRQRTAQEKAAQLVSLARTNHEETGRKLALLRRSHSARTVDLAHNAQLAIDKIQQELASDIKSIDAQFAKQITEHEALLELYGRLLK